MKFEKSCGALVFKHENEQYKLLLVKHNMGGHWSFPKGHVEHGESEKQTAMREVFEETGLKINILATFKQIVTYTPKPNVKKEVVYFLAKALTFNVARQQTEISHIEWMTFDRAMSAVTFDNDRHLIARAKEYLKI